MTETAKTLDPPAIYNEQPMAELLAKELELLKYNMSKNILDTGILQ